MNQMFQSASIGGLNLGNTSSNNTTASLTMSTIDHKFVSLVLIPVQVLICASLCFYSVFRYRQDSKLTTGITCGLILAIDLTRLIVPLWYDSFSILIGLSVFAAIVEFYTIFAYYFGEIRRYSEFGLRARLNDARGRLQLIFVGASIPIGFCITFYDSNRVSGLIGYTLLLVLLVGVVAMLWILQRTIVTSYTKENHNNSSAHHPPRHLLHCFIFIAWIFYLAYMMVAVSIQYGLLKLNEMGLIAIIVVLLLIEITLFALTLLTLRDYDDCEYCHDDDHHSDRDLESSSTSHTE